MAENVLKGFKVELASVFNQLSVEDKLNYLWFVRDDENATSGKIYLGSRLYSGEATTEDFNVLKERIENLVIKIDAVDTKVDAEDIKVNALDSKIDSVNEKIDVVKEECGVIYQKIDDIYDDSNRVREDVEEMKTQVSDAVNTVNNMEGKIDGEIARAEAAEAALQANIDDLNASKVSWLSKDDKRIVLENHKNLLGISTEGNTYNLAMVSKWDVADFGTTHLPLNLNSSEVPTVQLFGQTGEQAKHIAFAEDLTEKETSLQSKIDAEVSRAMEAEANLQTNINDTRNALQIVESNLQTNINDTRNALQIVESNLQTNINDTRNALELVESGLTQAIQQEAARAGEAEANLQTNINDTRNALQVVESGLTQAIQDMDAAYKQADQTLQANVDNVFNMITVEGNERKAADKQINETLATVNTNLVESINTLNKNMVDSFNTINGGIDNEIRPELERVGKLADSAVQQVSLVQDAENSLHYELLVDGEKVGDINIPKDQFLKSVTYEQATHELVFLFEVASGETETRVDMSELVDAYQAGNGLNLADNTFSIVVDPSTQAYIEVSENGVKIVGVDEAIKVEENRATAAEEALQGNIDAEVTRATEAEAALQASVDDLEANKVDWTSIATGEMPERKGIVLKNHDTILGTALNGGTYSLAMISKWDIADFGTTHLPLNLNSSEVPTVQLSGQTGEEAKHIAFAEDLTEKEAALQGKIDAEVTRATEAEATLQQAITAMDEAYKAADTTLQGNIDAEVTRATAAEKANEDKITALNEAYVTADLDLQSKIDAEAARAKAAEEANAANITSLDEAYKAADTTLQGNIDAEATRATEKETALQASVDDLEANKVGWTSVPTEDMPNRKSILLENHDTLLGKALDGTAYNLAMVSKWDKCDFGTTKLEINLNGSAERPTYNDLKPLALVDDIKYFMSTKALDAVKIFGLTKESTSDDIKKALTYLGTSKVVSKDELELCFANGFGLRTLYGYIYVNWDGRGYVLCMNMPKYLNQSFSYNEISIVISETGEYSVFRKREDVLATQNSVNENSGSIVSLQSRLQSLEDKVSSLSKTNVESYTIDSATTELFTDASVDYVISGDADKSYSISGKSVTINNMNVTNNARLTLNASSDVEVKNTVISGDFPKASGNAVVKVNNADYVVFKDMTFDATLYNAVEIGLSGSVLPKGVLFDNCKFLGKFTNNAISVFATQDNCVININNCEFQEVSNPLRLSNRTNVKCTVNITNCKFDKWESNPEYTGIVICQDYTSTAGNVVANNLFGKDKITVNVINCVGPNGAITKPKNISTVCGSKDANQLLYVFLDNGGGNLAYDADRYPTLNIN